MGTFTGTIIGTWFDAGATPELVKEYLCRFVDFVWTAGGAVNSAGEG